MEDIIAMARAAQRDDRLADGALYGKLADEIERLRKALAEIADPNLALLASTKADIARKALRELNQQLGEN